MVAVNVYFGTPDSGGADITGFEAQWKSGAQNFDVTRQKSGTGSPLRITGLTTDVAHSVRVRAENSVGDGAWSNVITVTPPTKTPPEGQAVVFFGEPEDGGAAVTGYDVQWRTPSQQWSADRQTSVTSSPVTLTSLVLGSTNNVRVRAKNSVGNGAWSKTIDIIIGNYTEGTPVEGPDVEGPDVEGPPIGNYTEGPDVEGPDVEGPDVEGPPDPPPWAEGPDVEGPDVEGAPVEGPPNTVTHCTYYYPGTPGSEEINVFPGDVPCPPAVPGPGGPRSLGRAVYHPEGPDVEGPDVEGPPLEGPFVRLPGPGPEGPDVEGPDVEGPNVEGPPIGNYTEGPDVEGPDVEGPDVEGPPVYEGPTP